MNFDGGSIHRFQEGKVIQDNGNLNSMKALYVFLTIYSISFRAKIGS